MTALIVAPISVGGGGWILAALGVAPILIVMFQSQRVHLTWRRIAGAIAAVLGLFAATALSGIICTACENCDPFWLILLGICIPK